MNTTRETMVGAAGGDQAIAGCKYSPTCPQFCVGQQPLCNGCYEHPYPFSPWADRSLAGVLREHSA
ncbi:MAG TPA: hypothetical protein VLD40_04760 [Dissulfurispiraceae bacterium]|nr:hypothetical protein [Dissulfurispiraceae bacterium]